VTKGNEIPLVRVGPEVYLEDVGIGAPIRIMDPMTLAFVAALLALAVPPAPSAKAAQALDVPKIAFQRFVLPNGLVLLSTRTTRRPSCP